MYFNEMAWAIENFLPDLIPMVKKTKIFLFEEAAHDIVPSAESEIIYKEYENFFLPFKNVCIEDPGTVIIIEDIKNKQYGWEETRLFVACYPFNSDPKGLLPAKDSGYSQKVHNFFENWKKKMGVSILMYGFIKGNDSLTNDNYVLGTVTGGIVYNYSKRSLMINEKGYYESCLSKSLGKATIEETIGNVSVALQQIMYLNNLKDRFIMEEIPKKIKVKKGMIARSHQRSKFTILTPKNIRKRMGLHPTGKALEEGHERRKHKRTYQHNRYTKMKGKTVIIEATWIGPHTKTIGNKIYKVRLDL